MRTTQASQLWCVQAHYDRYGWLRVSPILRTQGEAEHVMGKYAKSMGKLAIRTAPFTHREELK